MILFSSCSRRDIPCEELMQENITLRRELKQVSSHLEYTVRENQKTLLMYKQRLR